MSAPLTNTAIIGILSLWALSSLLINLKRSDGRSLRTRPRRDPAPRASDRHSDEGVLVRMARPQPPAPLLPRRDRPHDGFIRTRREASAGAGASAPALHPHADDLSESDKNRTRTPSPPRHHPEREPLGRKRTAPDDARAAPPAPPPRSGTRGICPNAPHAEDRRRATAAPRRPSPVTAPGTPAPAARGTPPRPPRNRPNRVSPPAAPLAAPSARTGHAAGCRPPPCA